MCSQEASPRLRVALRRGRYAGVGEDVADRGRRGGDAELVQFAGVWGALTRFAGRG
jgi:hypothetical protein